MLRKMKTALLAPSSGIPRDQQKILHEFRRDHALLDFCRFEDSEEPFLAASDKMRWEMFRQSLRAKPDILWCVRGGYGALRLFPKMLEMRKPTKPPCLVGISDITHLHIIWNLVWKAPSLHASLVDRMMLGKLPPDVEEETWRVLQGSQKEILHRLVPANSRAVKMKKALKGNLVGGNLSTLVSLLGRQDFKLKFSKKILFLEDRGERAYRLDRMLEQMHAAGAFEGLQGLLLGQFDGGEEPDGKNWIPSTLQRWADSLPLPVWTGVQSGHGEYLRPLVFGSTSVIDSQVLISENPLSRWK